MNEPNYQYPGINVPLSQPVNNYPRSGMTNINVDQSRLVQNPGNRQYVYQNNQPRSLNIYQSQSGPPRNYQNETLHSNFRNQQPQIIQPNFISRPQQNQPNPVNIPLISQSSHLANFQASRECKMDGIFAQSFTSLKKQILFHTFVVFILLFAVLLLYKIDIFKQNLGYMHGIILEDGQMKLSIVPFLIFAETFIIFFKLFIYLNTYHKLDFALWAANFIGHGVVTQRANKQLSFENNISQVYLLVSTQVTYEQGMQQKIKKLHKQITMNQIRTCVRTKACCSNNLLEIFEFGMFVCAIYLIVVLAQDHTTWIQKIVLISTLVYWLLQNYKLIIYILLFALTPLIILGVIVYVCVITRTPRREFIIPEAFNATNEQIINCGGTCTICMMDFDTTSRVIILPCSDKHMFHQLCIKGWLSVKSTCPICRFDLSTA